MREEKDHPSEYLNDLVEWNEHQYSPGHWTGANIPPYIKYGGRRLGVVLLILGILTIVVIPINLVIEKSFDLGMVIGLIIGILLGASGIRLIKVNKKN